MAMNMDASLRLSAKVDGLNNIVSLNRGLQSVESTAKGVTGAMRGLTGAAAGLSGALGSLAPLLSVAGLAGMVQNTIKAGDAMYDLSQRTGVSVEALARFKKAAATSGTDIDNVAKSLNILNKGMLEAATTGKGKAAEALKALGLSATNANGELKTADQVTLEVANKFKNMADGAAKSGLAMKLFGRNGAEMIPMLNMGGDAIGKLSIKMTEAFAKKADQYSDKLAILSGKVGALGADLTIALLPALQSVTDAVTTSVTAFNTLPESVKGLAVGAAALALAWGPITGLFKGAIGVVAALANGMEILRYQTALAGGAMPMLIGNIRGLGAAILALPGFGWMLAGAAALGVLTKALYDNDMGFRNWVNNIGNVVANDFANSMRGLGERAEKAIQYVKGLLPDLESKSKSSANNMSVSFESAFRTMSVNAASYFGAIGNTISKWWNQLNPTLRGILASQFSGSGVGLISSIVGYGTSASRKASMPSVADMGRYAPGSAQKPIAGLGRQGGASFTPDLSALGSGSSPNKSKDKDDAKRTQEAIRASAEALNKSKAELAILKETDPLKKIMLDYAEKERAINAQAKKDTADARSDQEKLNIKNKQTIDLDKLKIERTNELIQKYKELKGAGFEVAGSLEQWQLGAEKSNTALAGLRDGITSYLQSIGNLREQVARLSEQMLQTVEGSLSTAIGSAVNDFITGAQTIQQTMSDMFKSIGEAYIKMASEIIAKQLMMAAFNAILGIVGGSSGSLINKASGLNKTVGFGAGTITGFANGGVMSSNGVVPLKRYANGGVASSPQLALFGERGPEAYVPLPDGRSIPVKMKQRSDALNRYKPIDGSSNLGGADGSSELNANGGAAPASAIDVRYTVERINSVDYVTADQFQRGMQQAASQGAAQGEQRTLRRLQNSTGTRRRLGI